MLREFHLNLKESLQLKNSKSSQYSGIMMELSTYNKMKTTKQILMAKPEKNSKALAL